MKIGVMSPGRENRKSQRKIFLYNQRTDHHTLGPDYNVKAFGKCKNRTEWHIKDALMVTKETKDILMN